MEPDTPRLEDELVAVFQSSSGDARSAAFQSLYARHAGPVCAYLRRMCRHPVLAEDLTQETFLKALNGLQKFDSRSSFKTWLYRIATNLFRDHLRRKSTVSEESNIACTEREAPTSSPAEEADRNEQISRVRAAVDSLPVDLREPVVLVKLQGLSYAQAAEVLGATLATVRMRIHRAHLKLAEELKSYE